MTAKLLERIRDCKLAIHDLGECVAPESGRRAEIISLLGQAIVILARDDGGSLWRVMDAAKSIAEMVPGDSLGQPGCPTGRGAELNLSVPAK